MRLFFCAIFLYFHYGESKLWSKGVVHYAFNTKDYDLHSQDIMASAFRRLEKEICLKFFKTPLNHSLPNNERILYISNPKKRKDCPPQSFKYNKPVVDMEIGYKCLNDEDITMIVLSMLRASVGDVSKPNSYKLLRNFQEAQERATKADETETLLSKADRDFINSKYLAECGELVQKPVDVRRSYGGTMELTVDNERFYKDKLWPLGIVLYGADEKLMASTTSGFSLLQQAMATIELSSCVVFQHIDPEEPLQPKNLLWFGTEGEEVPHLGFMEGNQTLLLSSMIQGAPGHTAHTLNLLMRILGIPMMSNRYDRTNYVNIKWAKVAKMTEHYLERAPKDAWLKNSDGEGTAYDFDSVTHAPVNYMCGDCSLGEQTVEPVQDHLWQRTLAMGHTSELSTSDVAMLNLLYSRQCQLRFLSNVMM